MPLFPMFTGRSRVADQLFDLPFLQIQVAGYDVDADHRETCAQHHNRAVLYLDSRQMLTQWRWDFVASALVLSLPVLVSQEDK